MSEWQFVVRGLPVQQGSMRHVGNGRVIHSNAKALKQWRDRIAEAATAAGVPFTTKPRGVMIEVQFALPRPKTVPVHKRPLPTVAPDLDKLMRAVGDALTGVAYEDDAQVFAWVAAKHYAAGAEQVGVRVRVTNGLELRVDL